jgi:hypothetical protein
MIGRILIPWKLVSKAGADEDGSNPPPSGEQAGPSLLHCNTVATGNMHCSTGKCLWLLMRHYSGSTVVTDTGCPSLLCNTIATDMLTSIDPLLYISNGLADVNIPIAANNFNFFLKKPFWLFSFKYIQQITLNSNYRLEIDASRDT